MTEKPNSKGTETSVRKRLAETTSRLSRLLYRSGGADVLRRLVLWTSRQSLPVFAIVLSAGLIACIVHHDLLDFIKWLLEAVLQVP